MSSTVKEKANLARIRDNQRRSRARRKEYLQELEARLRQCDLQGIEASAEIQLAARRVAEENRKLRALLAQHGIGESAIEAHLQTPLGSMDNLPQSQYGNSEAVQMLEQLLHKRPPNCENITTSTAPNTLAHGLESRGSSASLSTVQSLWDPLHMQNAGPGAASSQLSGKASSTYQFMTPGTSTASLASSHGSNHGGHHNHHHQRMSSMHMPSDYSPNSSISNHQNHQNMFDFDPQLLPNPSYSSPQHPAQKLLQPLSGPQRSSVYPSPGRANANVNNCNYAAEMIATMAGSDPNVIRTDLGCPPDVGNCDVDNQLVFDVMDQYSGSCVQP